VLRCLVSFRAVRCLPCLAVCCSSNTIATLVSAFFFADANTVAAVMSSFQWRYGIATHSSAHAPPTAVGVTFDAHVCVFAQICTGVRTLPGADAVLPHAVPV
jgi:hypothetical protein